MAERAIPSVSCDTQTITIDSVDAPPCEDMQFFITKIARLARSYSTLSPLGDVRIIDMTRILAGPYCTMVLGDMGAQIFKIEMPSLGDETRRWPPYVQNTSDGLSCYFACVNRNKKSVCVNLKSKEGRKVIYDLAKVSDVLIENYIPGKLDSMKLGYSHISDVAPQLIYCSITGYGSEGRYKDRPGVDVIAASVGGLLHITGPEGGDPCKAGVAVTDIATGLFAHGAILAALIHRSKTGKGQKIDCDLLSTQVATLVNIGSNYLNAGYEGKRWGTAHASIVPYESFMTKNGFLTVGAIDNGQFVSLCERLGLPALSKDERFKTNPLRVKNRKELIDLLKQKFISKTTEEWSKLFDGSSFVYGPVNTIQQVFSDPHVVDIGLVEKCPLDSGEQFSYVRPPVTFNVSENKHRCPPPRLGQHTKEVLLDVLNYQPSYIDSLIRSGHVQ